MDKEKKRHDVFSIVTDRIIALLEQGTVPWQKPWTTAGPPQNLITKIPYRGVNVLLLSSFGFTQNLFLTFRQLKVLGAKSKPGEKPLPVIFWKWPEKKESQDGEVEGNHRVRPILRYYAVYNVAQCEGIPKKLIPDLKRQNDPIKACEDIVELMPNRPELRHFEEEAFYNPLEDYVNMPPRENFRTSADYYATLFHELVHSTGHQTRLNREEVMKFLPWDLENYSTEELVAEVGACFLQAHAGIGETTFENNAAYIKTWLSRLKDDTKLIVFASTQAQKAADYILSSGDRDSVPEEEHPTFAQH